MISDDSIEIELFLSTHPDIFNAQVVSVPDLKYGEQLMAWIVPKEGKILDVNAIREFCKGHLSQHKIPKYFEFTDEYPMTASGKIMKSKLQVLALLKANE